MTDFYGESLGPLKRAVSIPKVEIPKEAYRRIREETEYCGGCDERHPLRFFIGGTKTNPTKFKLCRACREGASA